MPRCRSQDGRRLSSPVSELAWRICVTDTRTVYHLIHRFFVIFTEIDGPTGGLAKLSAAGAIEKGTSRANDCPMDRPLAVIAGDSEIRVFSAQVKPAENIRAIHRTDAGTTYADRAFNRSVWGQSIEVGESGGEAIASVRCWPMGSRRCRCQPLTVA